MNNIAEIKDILFKNSDKFKKLLNNKISTEKFFSVCLSAFTNNNKLQNADKLDLLNCFIQCANDNLLLDGKEAALVFYSSKVSYVPMVAGIIKKMYESKMTKIICNPVYQKDFFKYDQGLEDKITHNIDIKLPSRGELVAFYAIAKTKNENFIEYMHMSEILKIRSMARNKFIWENFFNEMAKKTVIKRLAKRFPFLSESFRNVIDQDNRANEYEFVDKKNQDEQLKNLKSLL